MRKCEQELLRYLKKAGQARSAFGHGYHLNDNQAIFTDGYTIFIFNTNGIDLAVYEQIKDRVYNEDTIRWLLGYIDSHSLKIRPERAFVEIINAKEMRKYIKEHKGHYVPYKVTEGCTFDAKYLVMAEEFLQTNKISLTAEVNGVGIMRNDKGEVAVILPLRTIA